MNTLLPIFCTFFHVTYTLLHIQFSRKRINVYAIHWLHNLESRESSREITQFWKCRSMLVDLANLQQSILNSESLGEKGGGGGGGKQTNNSSFAFKDRLQKTRPGQNSPSVIISEHNSPFDGNTFVWLFVIYDHPVLRPFIHNSLNEPVIMAAPAQLTQG